MAELKVGNKVLKKQFKNLNFLGIRIVTRLIAIPFTYSSSPFTAMCWVFILRKSSGIGGLPPESNLTKCVTRHGTFPTWPYQIGATVSHFSSLHQAFSDIYALFDMTLIRMSSNSITSQ